ncbi:eukaryotic translation initiation factor 5 [Podarcis lilfordi]|uniref:Eukaryotic translation initiation factor 5 n=1 Tax=Podarcis lilfordi TaxID=74358 RepID=A0AA35JR47_9SAUR|nr:eukaryotic translation initiation factor 5 [Podarcis lilfordi]
MNVVMSNVFFIPGREAQLMQCGCSVSGCKQSETIQKNESDIINGFFFFLLCCDVNIGNGGKANEPDEGPYGIYLHTDDSLSETCDCLGDGVVQSEREHSRGLQEEGEQEEERRGRRRRRNATPPPSSVRVLGGYTSLFPPSTPRRRSSFLLNTDSAFVTAPGEQRWVYVCIGRKRAVAQPLVPVLGKYSIQARTSQPRWRKIFHVRDRELLHVSDQFYRYKMPRLIAKVEGKGNGIKTVIVNMVDVAKALNRPPTYPTKFFGCELGAQTQFDVKNDRYIVNGSHEANKLQDMLDGFIKKFVLCPECENPETDLHVNPKKQTIGNSCKACGYRGMLDTNHKLCTFILKNPPESSETGTGKKEKEKKNRKGKDKENGSVSNTETPSPQSAAPEELSPPHVDDDDDDWGEDTTEEAQRRRMDEISDHAKVLTLTDDLERTIEERVNILFDFVKKKKEEGVIETSDKDIVAEAERLDVKAMGPLVLTEVLFDEKIREQIKKYRRHFLRFCHNNKKAQRYLLHGLECVVAMHQSQLISKIPHILKEMYDADLLEEEVILSWAEKASKKYVSKELAKEIRVKAEPFIKWLKEAEEESSGNEEEEDEDENIEVVYSKTASVPKVETVKPANNKEEDIDIDAI